MSDSNKESFAKGVTNLAKKPIRNFLPTDLVIDSWVKIKSFYDDLLNRVLADAGSLEQWVLDRSELEAILEEDLAWRYIKMNIDTSDKSLADSFNFFVQEIEPKIAPLIDKLNKKLVDSEYLEHLDAEKYRIYLRSIKRNIELFTEANVPIITEIQTDSQKYGVISAGMLVTVDGNELTMQQAGMFLKDTNRAKRLEVFKIMANRRGQDSEKLNKLFTELLKLRNKVALNAGFDNYRDYKFADLGRFDYTVDDCYNFHESIKAEIMPIVKTFNQNRKSALKLDHLKPWDLEVDMTGEPPLKPFKGGDALLNKTISCFYKIDPFFGKCLETMRELGHLDLDSKQGKAPGGFNYPLHESGIPFIFMNAVGTPRDVVTMVHEGGHAVHSFLTNDLEITDFKSTPSEVAELASMGMELISMEFWDIFYDNEQELKRAKKEQLEKILSILPWIAIVDKFQHWLYLNPDHTVDERQNNWMSILNEFGSGIVDWEGFEWVREISWQRQLHIFEVPFYYIEYGMAQLGAIALWRNYKKDPELALSQYKAALKLGYTKTIGEIYSTAGIRFDFSIDYVKELSTFVKGEIDAL